MNIDIVTVFPELLEPFLATGMMRVAQDKGLVQCAAHDLRDYTHDRHRQVDDMAYGGGPGMVLKPDPLFEAVEGVTGLEANEARRSCRIVLLTPQGRLFNQALAEEFAREDRLLLLCGRYEGVDERVHTDLATDEVSIGDYVLSGGEVAAMAVIEATVRLVDGVLGDERSAKEDSFAAGLLKWPQYTRPSEYRGLSVPEVLLSGNHGEIERWRRERAVERTKERRPGLMEPADPETSA